MKFAFEPFSFLSCLSPPLWFCHLWITHTTARDWGLSASHLLTSGLLRARKEPARPGPCSFWSRETWTPPVPSEGLFYLPLPSVQVNQAKWEYFTNKKEFSLLEVGSGKQSFRNKQGTVWCLQSDSLHFHRTEEHSGWVWLGLTHLLGPRRKECPLTECPPFCPVCPKFLKDTLPQQSKFLPYGSWLLPALHLSSNHLPCPSLCSTCPAVCPVHQTTLSHKLFSLPGIF